MPSRDTETPATGRRRLADRLARWSRHVIDDSLVLKPRERRALQRLEADEAFARVRKTCRLRELPLASIFPGIDALAVPLGAINPESGHPNHAEMLYVVAVARHRGARRIFEFGTFMGRTTFHLAAALPDAHVWTLDLPRERNPWAFAPHVGSYFGDTPERARITSVREDAFSFEPGTLAGTMDFVWIDADHSYDGVKNDTEKAFRLLAPGGAVLWHDFSADSPGLAAFIAEFTRTRPLFHIARTSVLLHLDGIDPLVFDAHPLPFGKHVFKPARPV